MEKNAHKNGIEICKMSPGNSFILTAAASGVAKVSCLFSFKYRF